MSDTFTRTVHQTPIGHRFTVSWAPHQPYNAPHPTTAPSVATTMAGDPRERAIPGLTPAMLDAWLVRGLLIQRAMPTLSADDREFLMTGMDSGDWSAAFPDED